MHQSLNISWSSSFYFNLTNTCKNSDGFFQQYHYCQNSLFYSRNNRIGYSVNSYQPDQNYILFEEFETCPLYTSYITFIVLPFFMIKKVNDIQCCKNLFQDKYKFLFTISELEALYGENFKWYKDTPVKQQFLFCKH